MNGSKDSSGSRFRQRKRAGKWWVVWMLDMRASGGTIEKIVV
jgi:hypothetical protein